MVSPTQTFLMCESYQSSSTEVQQRCVALNRIDQVSAPHLWWTQTSGSMRILLAALGSGLKLSDIRRRGGRSFSAAGSVLAVLSVNKTGKQCGDLNCEIRTYSSVTKVHGRSNRQVGVIRSFLGMQTYRLMSTL